MKITIDFGGLLFLLFLALKLTHYIDWSWWWVTAPLWIGLAIYLSIALIGGIIWGVAFLIIIACEKWRKK
jgi:Transmembrane Fragile-X-F protein